MTKIRDMHVKIRCSLVVDTINEILRNDVHV